jgi:aminoglycoside phosphotransferase (APT) family kinase protein
MDATASVLSSLERLGLIGRGERPAMTTLDGGVSGDVYRVNLDSGPVCVKRALARLRVAGDWTAPVERSVYEVAWLKTVEAIDPRLAPTVIASDPASHLFVMRYLEPRSHPVWKDELASGRVQLSFAAEVGRSLGLIHAATAHDPIASSRFETASLFNALRIEPYLLATARAHTELAASLENLAAKTLASRIALVHGDISPKNILVGPDGPVFLDAECAWFGDPAFDLAFVATHLLLKTLWRPQHTDRYLSSLASLTDTYFRQVDWEPPSDLNARAAALLPALLLARVDGKSPAEYLSAENRAFIRTVVPPMIASPVEAIGVVKNGWVKGLQTL